MKSTVVEWLLCALRLEDHGRDRQDAILNQLKALEHTQVIRGGYLFKRLVKLHGPLFAGIKFAQFERQLFEMKASGQVANDRFGCWRLR